MNSPLPWRLAGAVALLALLLLAGAGLWLHAAYPTIFSAVVITVFVALALATCGVVALGLLALYNRVARWRTVQAHHITQLERARNQPAPNATSFTHAPRITLPALPAAPTEPPALALPAPQQIPTFAQLLADRTIGPDMTTMILGFDAVTHEPIRGDWNDLYSCGLGGLQGSGKTRAAAFLLAQSALMDGKLVICDPNPGTDDSLSTLVAPLAPAFLLDMGIASTDRDILAALQQARDKLADRKRRGVKPFNIIVCVDEWLALRRGALAELLPALVEDFSGHGRKYLVNAMLLAQRWDKEIVGDFRNTLASSFVFRMRRQEAAMLSGQVAALLPADTLSLGKGECYLLDTHGSATRIRIPQIEAHDLARVGEMLHDRYRRPIGFAIPKPAGIVPTATVASGKPGGSLAVACGNQATTASGTATARSPEAVRAASLYLAGSSPAAIVKELRGIGSNEGRRYQSAVDEIHTLIRQALGGNQ